MLYIYTYIRMYMYAYILMYMYVYLSIRMFTYVSTYVYINFQPVCVRMYDKNTRCRAGAYI